MTDLQLEPVATTHPCSLYRVSGSTKEARRFIASTPETRAICNDPFVAGISYTRALQKGCTSTISALLQQKLLTLVEERTLVLHILRGGLNFGLREAVADACNFRYHGSAFVSAQRARRTALSQDWIITESNYQKLALHDTTHVVLGDVVATGTSLFHGLQKLRESALEHGTQISGITFFTIGSPRTISVIEETDATYRKDFEAYEGSTIIFLEGVFEMATFNTPMQIKIDGTDLLRTNSLLAPEFVNSQYDNPAYPLERCTIYDAGSRAFDLPEYFEDVHDYWYQTLGLARNGLSFDALLKERFPELDASRFGAVKLEELCRSQLAKIPSRTIG